MSEQVFSFDAEQWQKLKQMTKENASSRGINFCTDFTFCQNQTSYTKTTQLQDQYATYTRNNRHTETSGGYNRRTPLIASRVKYTRYNRTYDRGQLSDSRADYRQSNYSRGSTYSERYSRRYSDTPYSQCSDYSRYSRYSRYDQVSVCNDIISYTRVTRYQEGTALSTNLPSVPIMLGTENGHIPILSATSKIALYSYDRDITASTDNVLRQVYYDVYIQQIKDKYGIRVTGQPLTKIKSNVPEDSIGGGLTFDFDTTAYVDGYYRVIAVARNAPKTMTFSVSGDASKSSETATYYMQDISNDTISKSGEYDGVSLLSGLTFGRGETNAPSMEANTRDVTSGYIYDMYSVSEVRIRQNHPAFFEAGIKNATQTLNMIFAGLEDENLEKDETRGAYNTTSKVLKTYGSDEIAGGDDYIKLRGWDKGVVANIELTESNTDQWVEVVGELINKETGIPLPNSRVVAQFPTDTKNPNAYVHVVKSGGIGVKVPGYLYWSAALFKEQIDTFKMEEYHIQMTVSEYTSADKATLISQRTFSSESVNDNGEESGIPLGFQVDIYEPIAKAEVEMPINGAWISSIDVNVNVTDNQNTATQSIGKWDCGVVKGNVFAELFADGRLSITGSGAMEDFASTDAVPWAKYADKVIAVDVGENVSKIGAFSCASMQNLISVRVGSGFTTVGENAFAGDIHLAAITGTSNLTEIGAGAFDGCEQLATTFYLPKLVSIGDNAFRNCTSVTEVTLGDTLQNMGVSVFEGCTGLYTMKIPDSIPLIPLGTFKGCSNLVSVDYSSTLTRFGRSAFEGCSKLQNIVIPTTVKYIKDRAFYGCSGNISIIKLTKDHEFAYLGAGAFHEVRGVQYDTSNAILANAAIEYQGTEWAWKSLIREYDVGPAAKATFDESTGVMTITGTDGIFGGHPGKDIWGMDVHNQIKSVVISEGISDIGPHAFEGCQSLTDVKLPSRLRSIGPAAFAQTKIQSIDLSKTSLMCIENNTFYQCTELTEVLFPNFIGSIEAEAFCMCEKLKTVDLTYTDVQSIGESAFAFCRGLTSLTLPSKLDIINAQAFQYCENLTGICTIPPRVTKIGPKAFAHCENITQFQIYLCDNIKEIHWDSFEGVLGSKVIYNERNSIQHQAAIGAGKNLGLPYKWTDLGASGGSGGSNSPIPDYGGGPGPGTFSTRSLLLQASEAETAIGPESFPPISLFAMERTAQGIEDRAGGIAIHPGLGANIEGTSRVLDVASFSADGTGDFYVYDSADKYAWSSLGVFGDMTVTNFEISEGITNIPDFAFDGCTTLQNIKIPGTVTKIGQNAFRGCTQPLNVEYSGTRKQWNAMAVASGNEALLNANVTFTYDSMVDTLWEYTESADKILLTKYIGKATDVYVPSEIKGKPVVVGETRDMPTMYVPESMSGNFVGPFASNTKITSVHFEDGVTVENGNASYMFVNCWKIGMVYNLPGNITTLDYAFAFSAIDGIPEIPDGVVKAFRPFVGVHGMSGEWVVNVDLSLWSEEDINNFLEITVIGDSGIRLIGNKDNARYVYKMYESGNAAFGKLITTNVMKVGGNAYAVLDDTGTLTITGTGDLYHTMGTNSVSERNRDHIGAASYAWEAYRSEIKKVVVEEGITNIPAHAFDACSNLKEVILPNSIQYIDEYAFFGCSGLVNINLPSNITRISPYTFAECTSLGSVSTENSLVRVISQSAFQNCTSLKTVSLNSSTLAIANNAFENCTALEQVSIPNDADITMIGQNAFANCTKISKITLPKSITTIDYTAFANVTGDRIFYYGDNVPCATAAAQAAQAYGDVYGWTMISEEAAWDCGVEIGKMQAKFKNGVLTITGIGQMKDFNQDTIPWVEYATKIKKIQVDEGVISIGRNAFLNCTGVTEVSLSSTVTTIGQSAFEGCVKLQTMMNATGVKTVGVKAFKNCTALTSTPIGSKINFIGEEAFYNCKGLGKTTIPLNIGYIGQSAFVGVNGVSYYSDSAEAKRAATEYLNTTPWKELMVSASSKLREVQVVYRDSRGAVVKTDEYSVANGKMAEGLETYQSVLTASLEENQYGANMSIDVVARDNVGNTVVTRAAEGLNFDTSTAIVKVDKMPKEDGGWYTEAISPVLTVEKPNGKEIETIKILESTSKSVPAISDKAWIEVQNPGKKFVYSTESIGQSTGEQYLHVYVDDGLHEPFIKTIGPYKMDLESPEVDVACNAIKKWQHQTTIVADIKESAVGSKLKEVTMTWYHGNGTLGGTMTQTYADEIEAQESIDITIPEDSYDDAIYAEIIAIDNAGNETKMKLQNIYLDTTSPIVSITPPAEDYPNWVKETIETTLHANKENGSPIKGIQIAEVKSITDIADVPEDAWVSIPVAGGREISHVNENIGQDSGEHYLYVRVDNGIDETPLEYGFGPYKVDLINPEVASVDLNMNHPNAPRWVEQSNREGWYWEAIQYRVFTKDDGGSKILERKYQIKSNPDLIPVKDAGWIDVPWTGDKDNAMFVDVTKTGSNYIHTYIKDNAGNENNENNRNSTEIKIDLDNPVLDAQQTFIGNVVGNVLYGYANYVLKASDITSGVKTVKYAVTDSPTPPDLSIVGDVNPANFGRTNGWVDITDGALSDAGYEFNLKAMGYSYVHVYVEDKAGRGLHTIPENVLSQSKEDTAETINPGVEIRPSYLIGLTIVDNSGKLIIAEDSQSVHASYNNIYALKNTSSSATLKIDYHNYEDASTKLEIDIIDKSTGHVVKTITDLVKLELGNSAEGAVQPYTTSAFWMDKNGQLLKSGLYELKAKLYQEGYVASTVSTYVILKQNTLTNPTITSNAAGSHAEVDITYTEDTFLKDLANRYQGSPFIRNFIDGLSAAHPTKYESKAMATGTPENVVQHSPVFVDGTWTYETNVTKRTTFIAIVQDAFGNQAQATKTVQFDSTITTPDEGGSGGTGGTDDGSSSGGVSGQPVKNVETPSANNYYIGFLEGTNDTFKKDVFDFLKDEDESN